MKNSQYDHASIQYLFLIPHSSLILESITLSHINFILFIFYRQCLTLSFRQFVDSLSGLTSLSQVQQPGHRIFFPEPSPKLTVSLEQNHEFILIIDIPFKFNSIYQLTRSHISLLSLFKLHLLH